MPAFRRKPLEVEALLLTSGPVTVANGDGSGVTGTKGDYLVQLPDGTQAIYLPEAFELEFEPLDENPAAVPE